MLTIKFLGAAGTVTGSSYLLADGTGRGILIDLGMFQGDEQLNAMNRAPLDLDVTMLDGMVLTHAHLDHCGRMPLLAQLGYDQPIYMTSATKALTEVVLEDAARIAEFEQQKVGEMALYTLDDVTKIVNLFRQAEYHRAFKIGAFAVIFRDAGHILGSASLEIVHDDGTKVVFSGDLGNSPQTIEKPTEMIERADVVVMESTYGGRTHPQESPERILMEEVQAVEKSGGVLLIPAFSLERTQVLLHMLDHLKKDGKILEETPVYLDSPMGIEATTIYKRFSQLYSKHMAEHIQEDDPFDFPGLEIVPKGWQSKKLHGEGGAKVIIAGSGMMAGGRIVRHAKEYLSEESTRLLIVGFQAEGTLGRLLQEGAETVQIDGFNIPVRASIREIHSMSAHADEPRLLAWLRHIQGLQQVFLTHGEDEARRALAERIHSDLGIAKVVTPRLGERISLEVRGER